jgi:hypothetical protein
MGAPRSPSAALAYARAEAIKASRDWTGYCLMFARICFGVAPRYGDATDAWHATNPAERHASSVPPAGVPVWWLGGRSGHGHVAVSAGAGNVLSTDIRRPGRVDVVPIPEIHAKWGLAYVGWTETINGVRVYTPPAPLPVVDASDAAAAFRHRGTVKNGRYLKRALADEVGRGLMNLNSDTMGGAARRAAKAVQVKMLKAKGRRVTRAAADGVMGTESLSWLASRRHRFKVKT